MDRSASSHPGTPNTTASLDVNYQSGLSFLVCQSHSQIDFQFRVVQTHVPPIEITVIPVSFHVQGSARASGDAELPAAAVSTITLTGSQGPFAAWGETADNQPDGSPGPNSYDNTDQYDIALDEVISGQMVASANVAAEIVQGNTSASVLAYVDPDIQIANAVIPGTAVNYRDYFGIEFAPGYNALSQVPVQETTWGRIKQLYQN